MLKKLPSCVSAKSVLALPQSRICTQRLSVTYRPTTQIKVIQNSLVHNSKLLGSGIYLNFKYSRCFATEKPAAPASETKKTDEADGEGEAEEGEEGEEGKEGTPEVDAFMDDSQVENIEDEENELMNEGFDEDKTVVYQFQDENKDQRLQSWRFIKTPNEGFTPNYKRIKAAYIGLPTGEAPPTVPLPQHYRNKSGLATKKGKALPQFVKEFEVPEPRYGINVEIFLNKIGKDCGKYADKFKSWDELMTFRRRELKKLEIPVKQRRWIRKWVEKYRRGIEPYAIKMKSIAKRNKEKKKEQEDAFKAIIKPRREATKVYRQKTAPLRLERKKIMKKITRLVKTIQKRERMERRQQLAAKKQEEQKQAEAKATV